jgi:hypothetical protein
MRISPMPAQTKEKGLTNMNFDLKDREIKHRVQTREFLD